MDASTAATSEAAPPNGSPETSDNDVKATGIGVRLDELERELDAIRTELVGQEHRLIQVVRNAYHALTSREGWSSQRRLEAGAALIRYFFARRTALVVGVSVGGLLALHASFMLADQSRKLDLQNYLSAVNSEAAEAQRNSQFVQLIPPLLEDLTRAQSTGMRSGRSRAGQEVRPLGPALGVRVAALTQTLSPYRWTEGELNAFEVLERQGNGWLYNLMSSVRNVYDAAFGQDLVADELLGLKLPKLTEFRRSPERGLLLVSLHSMGFDLADLTKLNATFERSYAPGAQLAGSDLGTAESPGFNLKHSFLEDATFERAFVQHVKFFGADLSSASFDGANAHGADFGLAALNHATFVSTRLTEATFMLAKVANADFRLANLVGANLSSADGLADTNVSDACLDPQTTKMPPEFKWERYKVPSACCDRWSGAHGQFDIHPTDGCRAKLVPSTADPRTRR